MQYHNEQLSLLYSKPRQEATKILSDAKENAQKTSSEIVANANTDAASIRKKNLSQ